MSKRERCNLGNRPWYVFSGLGLFLNPGVLSGVDSQITCKYHNVAVTAVNILQESDSKDQKWLVLFRGFARTDPNAKFVVLQV